MCLIRVRRCIDRELLNRCTRQAACFKFGHRFRVSLFNGSLELNVLIASLILILCGIGQGKNPLIKDFFGSVDAQLAENVDGSISDPIGTTSDRVIRASPPGMLYIMYRAELSETQRYYC